MFVSSRSLAEYIGMFGSDLLDGRTILDCASGAASFTAELTQRGNVVTAVDPLYGVPMEKVIASTLDGVLQATRNVAESPGLYSWGGTFRSPAHHAASRAMAAGRFLGDFEQAGALRYIRGQLPELPFADSTFDTIVSSHYMFAYAGSIPAAAHIEGISEMLRVCRSDVRVFPLTGFDGDSSRTLKTVCAHFARKGVHVERIRCDYRFFGSASNYLRLSAEQG